MFSKIILMKLYIPNFSGITPPLVFSNKSFSVNFELYNFFQNIHRLPKVLCTFL